MYMATTLSKKLTKQPFRKQCFKKQDYFLVPLPRLKIVNTFYKKTSKIDTEVLPVLRVQKNCLTDKHTRCNCSEDSKPQKHAHSTTT